jgi:hypothetical protein
VVKAGKIEQFALNCQHTEDVIPLPVGDLAPEAIPFELGEDGVFGTARASGLVSGDWVRKGDAGKVVASFRIARRERVFCRSPVYAGPIPRYSPLHMETLKTILTHWFFWGFVLGFFLCILSLVSHGKTKREYKRLRGHLSDKLEIEAEKMGK